MQVSSTATIRPDLADAVREYAANLEGQFMGLDLLPIVQSQFKDGSFGKLPVENVTDGSGTLERAPGSGYNRQQSSVETDTYACQEYGIEEPVDDSEAKRIGIYFNAEVESAMLCKYRLMRAQEIRIATMLFNASNFSGYTGDVGNEWDDATNGTPYSDIQNLIPTLKSQVGGVIDGELCFACSEHVYRHMVATAEIKALRAGGAGSNMNQQFPGLDEMASLLGLNKLFVSNAQSGGADIWSNDLGLLFIRNQSNLLSSSVQLGRSFLWNEDSPANAMVESYRDEIVRSNIIRVRQNIDEKVFNYAAGYLLSDLNT